MKSTRVLISFLASACLVFVFLTSTFAQAGRGTIAGKVSDTTGASLVGARVLLLPIGVSATTNGQGEFSLSNVPAGNYTLSVEYVGFSAFSTSVEVAANHMARADVTMKVSSAKEEVVVYAERVHGEAEAINRQRESDNILQVLPVDVITSLPNTNIADAVGRLPSVTLERDEGEGKYIQIRGAESRYNNVTVDGVEVAAPEASVRQIKLDTVPANLIDSVEINKTLSANQDGDAIGGSVNLVTKTADERPTFYINGIGGYTPIIGGRTLTEMDSYVGDRFGANKKLGILIGGSYDWNGRGINDVEPVPTVIPCGGGCSNPNATAPFFTTYSTEDIRDYRYNRTRYGFTGSVDYKLGDVSGIYIRTLYSHFDNYGDRWVYTPTVGTFQTPLLTNADGNMTFNVQARRPIDVIGSLQVGGKHVFSQRWILIWDAAVSRSSETDNGYSSADFTPIAGSPLNNVQFAINPNSHTPRLIAQGGVNIFDTTQYSLTDLDINKTYSPQLNLETAFTASRTYTWGTHYGTFEFGGKFRNAHKFQDAFDPDYNFTGANAPLLSSFAGNFSNSDYYDGAYPGAYTTPQADYGKVVGFFNGNQGSFTVDEAGSLLNTFSNNFDIIERVGAWYGMNTLQFGRVRVQTGLRFEETTENLFAYNVGGGVPTSAGGTSPLTFTPLTKDFSYLDPLPSAQVRFALGQNSDIRVSYGRGIARPNFGDLPPSFGMSGITLTRRDR